MAEKKFEAALERLEEIVEELEKGDLPPGVSLEHQHVRSAAVVLAPEENFNEAAKEALRVRPGIEHATV